MNLLAAQGADHGGADKHATEGGVADIQAACIGPEGWQDDPLAVTDEASATHGSPRRGDPGAGVKVACDLLRLRA